MAYMDFKKTTDELMAGMTRGEIATALGCSEASVRQAKLDEDAAAHRAPPKGWEPKLADLAEKHGKRLLRVAETLRKAPAK